MTKKRQEIEAAKETTPDAGLRAGGTVRLHGGEAVESDREESGLSEYLLDQLLKYAETDAYPLHMPGHKRQVRPFPQPFAIDITEIDGFDNLHHPEGILLEAQKRAARLYGAEETYYLVNGSTCGILAAVSASVRRGGRILMARNCHKSAYNAALLNDLRVTWLYPETDLMRGIYGSIRPEQVREALREQRNYAPAPAEDREGESEGGRRRKNSGNENGDRIAAVLITSPTYDGVVSDIRAIAREVHRAGAILVVDEAHGAHFAMHPYFPESALACGADLVINSLHKTMPSLTQTAFLHVQGTRVDRERLREYLGIYQTSSPSYVLMAGMDECVRLMEQRRQELFDSFVQRLERLRQHLGAMRTLHLVTGDEPELNAFAYDRSRLVISMENCTGPGAFPAKKNGTGSGAALAKLLRERYHLEVEMEAERYVTAILTVADTQEGFDRLEAALLEIDAGLGKASLRSDSGRPAFASDGEGFPVCSFPDEVMTMTEADNHPHESVLLSESPGRVAGEFVYLYPPGIPLLVPGERIPDALPELLAHCRSLGLHVQGLADTGARRIRCVAE